MHVPRTLDLGGTIVALMAALTGLAPASAAPAPARVLARPRDRISCPRGFVCIYPDIHMTPAEGMQAHLDLQGGKPGGALLPIHWGTFNLAPHAWAEPAELTMLAAHDSGQVCATPIVGQPFEPAACPDPDPWWRKVAVTPDNGWAVWPRVPADATDSPEIAAEV